MPSRDHFQPFLLHSPLCVCFFFSGDRSEPVSAEISFYSRGGSIPCSLKAQVTATYVTNSGEFILKKHWSLFRAGLWTRLTEV